MIIIKKGFFIISIGVLVLLQSGCEVIDSFRQKPETVTTEAVQTEPHTEPAAVIESFYDETSNWRPILPHELDAHFEESETLLRLLRYSRRLGELTPKELNQEYKSFQKQPKSEKAGVNMQLQQALLLSAPAAPYRDNQRAKKILADIINSGEKRGLVLREYAYSLLVSIEQREKAEQQNLQLRKSLKKEIERRKLLEQKRELLEQKLEALKSIEESITQRQNTAEEAAP
jgi:hypothetical protein